MWLCLGLGETASALAYVACFGDGLNPGFAAQAVLIRLGQSAPLAVAVAVCLGQRRRGRPTWLLLLLAAALVVVGELACSVWVQWIQASGLPLDPRALPSPGRVVEALGRRLRPLPLILTTAWVAGVHLAAGACGRFSAGPRLIVPHASVSLAIWVVQFPWELSVPNLIVMSVPLRVAGLLLGGIAIGVVEARRGGTASPPLAE